MTDEDLLALNVYEEAGGEVNDGQAAIARVTLNRMRLRFMSDGTVAGTVLAKDQFSWAWFGFVTTHSGVGVQELTIHRYVRVAHDLEEATNIANSLFKRAVPNLLFGCRQRAASVMAGTYSGTLYDQLTDDTVNYLNPKILTKLPAWAIPAKLVCSIGRHDFYRA